MGHAEPPRGPTILCSLRCKDRVAAVAIRTSGRASRILGVQGTPPSPSRAGLRLRTACPDSRRAPRAAGRKQAWRPESARACWAGLPAGLPDMKVRPASALRLSASVPRGQGERWRDRVRERERDCMMERDSVSERQCERLRERETV